MKRTFLLLFTMLSCLFFVSCGDEPEVTKKESQDNQQEQKQNDDQKPDDGGTKTDTPEEVKIENGTIKSAFSVSSTQKVYFSTGNLQYQASAGTWQFAENQYDVIGKDNSNISSTNAAFIDLFGWGTSGWENGVEAFQPYSTEYDYAKYYVGGSSENNLVGSYANADWGVYNSISNGGGKAGMWRTLTAEEWYYVIKDRKNAYDLYSVAKVNGVNGLILLPDNWTTPSSIEFINSCWTSQLGIQTSPYPVSLVARNVRYPKWTSNVRTSSALLSEVISFWNFAVFILTFSPPIIADIFSFKLSKFFCIYSFKAS